MQVIVHTGMARKALVGAVSGGMIRKTLGGSGLQADVESRISPLSPAAPDGNGREQQPQNVQRTKRAVASAP